MKREGIILIISAPSGAGKTTLLYTLAGLERPESGCVEFEGRRLYAGNETAEAKLRNEKMGFVFQGYCLLPEHTALANVMLHGMIGRRSGCDKAGKGRGGARSRPATTRVGNSGASGSLVALPSAGLRAVDGTQWMAVNGAPSKGRTLAVRGAGQEQLVFIAGSSGVKAGHVAADGKWTEREAPDAQFASVFGGSRSTDNFVFLTSRQQHQMLVAEPKNSNWRSFPLPSWTAEVTSVALDPFDTARLYVGTLGEGIFIYEGKSAKYEAKKKVAETVVVTGTN